MVRIPRAIALLCIGITCVIAGVLIARAAQEPGVYDGFANCLKNTGVKFYGAFWCPHCHAEKQLFGPSKRYLPYVECSTLLFGQRSLCASENIEAYPTWKFPDGNELVGEQSLADLAGASTCTLPQ
jgi:hypothetical protein